MIIYINYNDIVGKSLCNNLCMSFEVNFKFEYQNMKYIYHTCHLYIMATLHRILFLIVLVF